MAARPRSIDADVELMIDKFAPEIAKAIRAARRALRKRLPTANELVYDNYNFFVIGYSSTDKTSDAILSLAADANGLNLHFYWGAKLKDPKKLLSGSGVQNRFIRLESAKTLAEPSVEAFIAAACGLGKNALAKSGKGYTEVRGISGKQRPRR